MDRRTSLVLALVCGMGSGAGCRAAKLAGEPVGQYAVLGVLEENTCAEGYPSANELWFHVELRDEADSTLGYWKLPDAPIADGQLNRSEGTFRFEERVDVTAIDSVPAAGIPGCVLARTEVISGTFGALEALGDGGVGDGGANDVDGGAEDAGAGDAGSADAGVADAGSSDASSAADASTPNAAPSDPEVAFRGTIAVSVEAVPGGDCTSLLDPTQGGFPVLPCSIRYRLSGDRLEENIW